VDVAVVGAGPAGLAAACRAAESGARVLLLDEQPAAGGQIWRAPTAARAPRAARRWLERLERSGAERLGGSSVFDAQPGRLTAEWRGERLTLRAPQIVVATGARELFLPFPGWTLPGVIGAGAAQALLKQGAPFAGRRVVVSGSGPLLLVAAAELARGGARVVAIAEQAPLGRQARFAVGLWRQPGKLAEGLTARMAAWRARYRPGTWASAAHGDGRVEAVTLSDGRRQWREACDLLCCGYGLVPNLELARLLGCETPNGVVQADERQRTTVAGVLAAGEPTGVAGVEQALVTGQIAGLTAAGREPESGLLRARAAGRRFAARLARAFSLRDELRALPQPETIVCRCEDVRWGALPAGGCLRAIKLETRAGMGACQGRVCGSALAFLRGAAPDHARPPLVPVPLGLLLEEETR
jgi:NADPH-dependent 2,4-dienoyl-CoA reductase/sulfur reductase-like enzyme